MVSAAALKQLEDNLFRKLDANGDGSITKAEAGKALAGEDLSADTLFKKLDTNGDSAITRSEFDAALAKATQQMQSRAPRAAGGPPHGGGGGPKAEGAGGSSTSSSKVYDVRDTNQDGVVSAEEQYAYDLTHPTPGTANQQTSAGAGGLSQIDVSA